jgi:protein-tyrosine phosphatase
MAEFVMKDLASREGLGQFFHIESAATSSEELGNPIHPGTARKLDSLGIDYSEKRARRIRKNDYENFDFLIGMDEANMRSIRNLYNNDPENKVRKLLEYAGSSADVADPWYTHDFESCFQDVCDGCTGLMNELCRKLLH